MLERIPFSQLWIEEEQYLRRIAAHLPDNASIVEIGTGQGGSAYIFGHLVGKRGGQIHSFDIAPSPEAYDNVADLNVSIHVMSSSQGASKWIEKGGKSIDLLFIDGGHSFLDVHNDFSLWSPFVRNGGWVLFHDYDPIERGSVVHLGVRLFCETILRLGYLKDVVHEGRLLAGHISIPDGAQLKPEDFSETWRSWGRKLERIMHAEWRLITGEAISGKSKFVRALLKNQITNPADDDVLQLNIDCPFSTQTLDLAAQGKVELVDDWTICYLIQHALKYNKDLLLNSVSDRGILFKYSELNDMLSIGVHAEFSIDDVFITSESNLDILSSTCATEVVRLHFLDQIAHHLH